MQRLVVIVVLMWAVSPTVHSQTYAAGPQTRTYHSAVDDSDQPYALYLPQNFDPQRKYPLVISLHAEETNHAVNLVQLFGLGIPQTQIGLALGRGFPRLPDIDYIVACPFARGSIGYQGIAERDTYDVLADVERRYPIDPDRVYLTGISMGGGGALWLALTRPDVWAGVVAICPSSIPASEQLAPNALNLPIRIYHGDQDIAVPVASSRAWQRRLSDAGDPVEYFELSGSRHNVWDAAYKARGEFDWFSKLRRNPLPERVRLVAREYRYASAYWIALDDIAPGALASMDAQLVSRTEAKAATRDVNAFTLAARALDLPALVTIDGDAVRVKAGAGLSFVKTGGHWKQGRAEAGSKKPGAEGPIATAESGAHIYVYGTADDPPQEVLDARRRVAERAADWSVPTMARPTLKLEVKADAAVTASDIARANLVLFGTRETNSMIARIAPEMPLALNAGAADYGLLFIAPAGGRFALISSGLPWWTGAAQAARGGDALRAASVPPSHHLRRFHLVPGLACQCGGRRIV